MVSSQSPATQNVILAAQKLLTDHWGLSVTLHIAKEFYSQHTVLRCTVENAPSDQPDSVILKVMPHHDFDRRAQGLNPANRFFNEWCSMEFLKELPDSKLFAPTFILGDEATGLLISADLGEHPSLIEVLEGDDLALAQNAIIQAATSLGKMHASSIGRAIHFQNSADRFNYVTPLVDGNADLRQFLDMITPMFDDLAIETSDAFWEDFNAVETRLQTDGGFYGFTHFDLGPHNIIHIDGSARLMDFETAKYGHVLIDAVDARMNFSSCTGVRRIPDSLVAQWETAHRNELAKTCAAATDDAHYYPAMVDACAHWAIQKTGGFYRQYLKGRLQNDEGYDATFEENRGMDSTWLKTWTITRLRSFVTFAEEHDCLPHTRSIIQQLIAKIESVLPELDQLGDLELFPAFQ